MGWPGDLLRGFFRSSAAKPRPIQPLDPAEERALEELRERREKAKTEEKSDG